MFIYTYLLIALLINSIGPVNFYDHVHKINIVISSYILINTFTKQFLVIAQCSMSHDLATIVEIQDPKTL